MSDEPVAATFGGPGWRARVDCHSADVAAGRIWRKVGVTDEYSPLREVLISAPSAQFRQRGDPEASLMLSWPALEQLESEQAGIQAYFDEQGVHVHVHRPAEPPPLNYLFMRDLIITTPEGAIVCRPASPVRAPEARWVSRALGEMGVPILGMPTGDATLEGADALWLDSRTLLLGTGARTNASGARWLRRLLEGLSVDVIEVPIPSGAQHLLGVVVPVGPDRVIVDAGRVTPELSDVISRRGMGTIRVDDGPENRVRRGMNVVVLGPNHVVMPAGCPGLATQFRREGLRVDELVVDAYVQAAGALGCLTAVLRRETPESG